MATPNIGSIQLNQAACTTCSPVEDESSQAATLKAQQSLARIESNRSIPGWIYSCFCYACSIRGEKRGAWTPMNTNKLDAARRDGLKYFSKRAISSLLADGPQYAWIMSQLIIAVIFFGFAIGGIVRDNRTVYDIARVIITGIFLLYCSIDALIKLINHGCVACCTFDVEMKSEPEHSAHIALNEKDSTSNGVNKHPENSKESKMSRSTTCTEKNLKKKNTVPEYTVVYNEDPLPKSFWRYLNCVNIILTFIRSIFPEVFFYILLLLHIFQHSYSRNYEKFDFNNNKFDGSFFLFVVVAYIAIVYIVRIFLWSYVFYSIQKSRKHSSPCCDDSLEKGIKSEHCCCCCYCCCCNSIIDKLSENSETFQELRNTMEVCSYPDCCLLVRVFFQVVGQMLVQTIMITSIWVKIEYEQQVTNGDPGGFSPYLWCMILGGFFLPLIGNIAFLIPNYYWIEEFLVGLRVDEVKNDLEKASMNPLECEQFQKLKKDYQNMKSHLWFEKFTYPFISPGLVFLSFLYCVILLSFAVFATLSYDENRFTTYVALDGSVVWIIFFVIGVILVNVVNIQVVIITAFWCLVLLAILSLVCLVIAVVGAIIYFVPILICVFCFAAIASQTK